MKSLKGRWPKIRSGLSAYRQKLKASKVFGIVKDSNLWLLGFFAAAFIARNPDHYREQTTIALLGISIYLTILISKRVHFIAGLFFNWTMVRAIAVFVSDRPLYQDFASASANLSCKNFVTLSDDWKKCADHVYSDTVTAFKFVSADATVNVLLISWAALLLTKKHLEKILNAFSWLGIFSAAVILIRKNNCSVLDNAAMDACFLVTLLPLILFRESFKPKWLSIFLFAAIVKSGSSTAFLATAVLFLSALFASNVRNFLMALIPTALLWLGLSAVMPLRHALFDSYGRTTIWKDAWALFQDSPHKLGGLGTGTYFLWGSILRTDQTFIWLHNDWFQIGFEQGYIGLALALTLFGVALYRARNSVWKFSALATTGFTMVSQMPLRHTLAAFYAAVLLRIIFGTTV